MAAGCQPLLRLAERTACVTRLRSSTCKLAHRMPQALQDHVVRPLATDARVGSRGPRILDPTWLWKYIDIGIVLLLVVIVAVVAQLFSLLFVSLVLFK